MKRLFPVIVLLLFASCSSKSESSLYTALDLAGNNRHEIQKVLDHYCAPGDSLKRRAAEYLIANMAGKYTVTSPALEAYEELLPEIAKVPSDEGLNSPRIGNMFRAFRQNHPQTHDTRLRKQDDLRHITADYLIRCIDASFDTWENTPWHDRYTFEQFCEYVLPYRSMTEYLSDWKTDAPRKDLWWDASFDTILDPVELCHRLNRKIDFTFNHGMNQYGVPQSYVNLLKSHWGNCIDETNYALFQMRGNGIPVAIDFVPQWASLHDRHYWNVILDTTGQMLPFQVGFGYRPGLVDLREKVAKIYRHTYEIQRDGIVYRRLGKEDIPPVFSHCNIYDVTAQYGIPVADVTLDVKDVPKGTKILYLCVSSLKRWEPVAYAEIKGSKAVFRDVSTGIIHNDAYNTQEKGLGEGIVLLPAYYLEGKIVPAREPLILTHDGSMHSLTPDTSRRHTVVLKQKMRLPYRFIGYARQMTGNRFEGANRPDFSDAVTLAQIKDSVASHMQKLHVTDTRKYRYVRYVDEKGFRAMVGELAFFDENGRKIAGHPIGVRDRYWYQPKDRAFDDDIVTFYEAADKESWIGLDLGERRRIDSVGFSPRTTGNEVEPGDTYTLYYWDGLWREIGTKTAYAHEITFDGVPENALLLLSDRTKGKEERIFTYKDGEQIWW